MYAATVGARRYVFADLKTLLAKATPPRSGDALAGLIADSGEERVAAQFALADLPLTTFLNEAVVPYEQDEVTRLIIDSHDTAAFAAGRASDRRRLCVTISSSTRRDRAGSDRACARPDAGNGRRRRQDQPPAGPDGHGGEMLGGDPLPQHDRPARPALRAPATEPPDRRCARHRRQHSRRPAARRRRRRHRHQSGDRQPGTHACAAVDARRHPRASSISRRKPACWRMSPRRST